MLNEFISTAYFLVIRGKWEELHTYFKLIKEILGQPRAVIIPGIPTEKDR